MQWNAALLVAVVASAPCTDTQVALLTWRRALGAGPAPDCAVQPGQQLQLDPRRVRAPRAGAVAAVSAGSTVRRVRGRAARPYAVHIAVFTVGEHWCAAPCHQPTWEVGATKPQALDGPYQLLEAAIWLAEKRVALYAFDEAWDDVRAQNPCYSTGGFECPAYFGHREQARVLEVRWQGDPDGAELSAILRGAFEQVFAEAQKRDPEHVVLTYSGHGGKADGSLFEGRITKEDSAALLGTASATKKLSLLNFGTNCREAYMDNLVHLEPFAHLLTASELNVNGVTQFESDAAMAQHLALRAELEDLHLLKGLLEQRTDMQQVGIQVLDAWQKIWDDSKVAVAAEKLKQTKALFDLGELPAFRAALRAKAAQNEQAKAAAEATLCDVQTYAEALGEEEAWRRLRPHFVSTQALFTWDVETHGLGFNFLHYRAPPCDLGPVT